MEPHKGYLFLHNIGKRNNIGSIIRTACAFNLDKVYFVGHHQASTKLKTIKDFTFFGNKGTLSKTQFQGFNTLKDAKEFFKQNNLIVCGVEIGEGSQPIHTQPFRGNTVFFLGNEGTGLIPVHREMCDHFVYIPQYSDKTASLNVGVAAGIIFHHFALWAGFKEAQIFGEKFREYPNSDEEENGYCEKEAGQVKKKHVQGKKGEQVNAAIEYQLDEQLSKITLELPGHKQ